MSARRFSLVLLCLLIAVAGLSAPLRTSGAVASRAHQAADKKVCKTVTKKVHGKKKTVRVCKTVVTPTPTDTPTPTNTPTSTIPPINGQPETDSGCGCTGCAAPSPLARSAVDAVLTRRTGPRADTTAHQSAGGTAHTPPSKKVEVFVPFAFDGGFPASDYQAATASLTSEGYQVAAPVVKASLSDTNPVTIPGFLASAGDAVVIFYGHGGTDWVPIESFTKTPAGQAAFQTALARYQASYGMNNISFYNGPATRTYQIGLSVAGLRNLYHPRQAIVIWAVCHGSQTGPAVAQGGSFVLWYNDFNYSVYTGSDLQCLFSRLDGTAYPAAGLDSDRLRNTDNAWNDCQGKLQAGASKTSSGPISLAPAVRSREPDPDNPVPVNGTFKLDVEFDTAMQQSAAADSVVTLQGCGTNNDKPDTVQPLQWTGNGITGMFRATKAGTLTITVHSDQAVSADDAVQLDGNQNGGTEDTPVAPNADDFEWKVQCVPSFEFSNLTVAVDVHDPSGSKTATKTYTISGYTCSVQTDNTGKIIGGQWALHYSYNINGYGGINQTRTADVKMHIPDKTINQDGESVPLVPDAKLTDPSGMQINLAGLYNSDPTQLFVKATVGYPQTYSVEQPTQLVDMPARAANADSSACK